MDNKRKKIQEQIDILEEAIKGMFSLAPFKLNKAKEYDCQIKELFVNLILKGYLKVETDDLDLICKESLDKWNEIDYFLKPKKNSTFQQVFYLTKPQKTALILGCSLYLMIFENLLNQFDDKTIRSTFADIKNKEGIHIGSYTPADSKIKTLIKSNELNSEFLKELDKNLRNAIAHFDFQIYNKKLVYGDKKVNKSELREKTKKILWLNHIILLNKDLAIREYLLKKFY